MKNIGIGLLAVLCCLPFLFGCGGGSQGAASNNSTNSGNGALQFNINWPTSGRLIPAAAQSLVITLTRNSQTLTSRVIPRPPPGVNTSSVRFDNITPGVVTVTVTAFPNADGTGVAQATGAVNVAIISGETTQANVNPASTIDHLDVAPNPLSALIGLRSPIILTPRDSANNIVLVAPSVLQWSSANPLIATVDNSGVVTGVAHGQTTVMVLDTESGKTAQAQVFVVPVVVINPPAATLTLLDTQQFTATVTGFANTNVTWSIQEGAQGGTISQTGLYTAPNTPGTFHVIATSVADPTQNAVATVTVQSGSGTVIIQ